MVGPDTQPKTILFVDDERDLVFASRVYLEAQGYRVLEAYDGMHALEVLRDHTPDLIIMDVAMPRLNGWDALSTLQRDERLRDIPVLMLTALGEPSQVATGLHLGCTWYYTKPVTDYDELGLVIRRILDGVSEGPGD